MNGIHISLEITNNISKAIGLDYETIVEFDPMEESELIGKRISFSKKRDLRKVGRGNPLFARHKIRTIDNVNKALSRLPSKNA